FKQAIIQDPTITTKLKGFVRYTDAISNYPATKGSVPSFLTGKMIPEDGKYKNFLTDYVANFGLPQMFNDKGYLVSVISVYSWFKPFFKDRFISQPQLSQKTLKSYYSAQLLDYSLFRTLPHAIKAKIFNQGEWFTSEEVSKKAKIPNSFPEKGNFFLDLMTENAMVLDPTPRFKMIHVTTPHPEYKFNRDCELSQLPAGKHAMLEQSMCALKKLDNLLSKYKELGIYDNSLIVVTSDHGSRIILDKSLTGFPSYFEMNTSAILFMIKGIGQKDDFFQVNQPFSLIKLYDAMLDEELHSSNYDFLQDDNRLFYAFRNHHEAQEGYFEDAPLFEVGPNALKPESWKLKKFVTSECEPQSIPVKMTFLTNGREGYCSIFGFSKPHTKRKGSYTESVDTRIILELEQSKIKVDDTYKIVLGFSPYFAGDQQSIKLKVMINDVAVGEQLITTKGKQTISFNFEGSLIHLSEQTVIQLLMPDLKSPKQMFLNNNTQKLGLLMRSIEVKRVIF
ncbi:MAG: sulfatase-like hydrolase/transferase, partial [Proteobacteria bacterium]|nr:sulfatase-like hydrolase/transferase [Pseudomonadota bacterium]